MIKIILTGHTRGLGLGLAHAALAQGIDVLGLARRHNAELAQDYGSLLVQTELDLANPAALQQWLETGQLQHFLDGASQAVLINNAGLVSPVGPLHAQALPDIAQAVAVNVTAPMLLAAALLQTPPKLADTRILHISSGAARSAYPGWSVYCATKAALDMHAQAVHLDNLPRVRICSLAPGVIDTDMQAQIRATPPAHFPNLQRFKDLKSQGGLESPIATGQKILAYLLSPGFGSQPVLDIRSM